MCGQDWVKPESAQPCGGLIVSHFRNHPFDRARQRVRCRGAVEDLARAQYANAMMLLSQVAQVKVAGEGTGDLLGPFGTE